MLELDSALYLVTGATAVVAAGAEWLHLRRAKGVERLVYGRRPKGFSSILVAAMVRVVMLTVLAWSLMTLLLLPAKNHSRQVVEVESKDRRHLLLILDVSPSMRLQDAGSESGGLSRTERASVLVQSLLKRITDDRLHITMVAVYNGAKPVVQESRDTEVILNFLDGLPLSAVFPKGKTKLFDGLKEAAQIAQKWPRDSTTLLLVSDGDTVPATGRPQMPASVSGALVLGVGNPTRGSMIDGRQSRQDVGALRQIASRLGGEYHDGNLKHVPTQMLSEMGAIQVNDDGLKLTRREYALIGSGIAALVLALLPLLLNRFGSTFSPGPRRKLNQS
ncbi:MAG: VWA domain-containing protein [Verrucomicrobiota bacterium]